jgi:hypothetical protein
MKVLNYRFWNNDYNTVAKQIVKDCITQKPDIVNICVPEEDIVFSIHPPLILNELFKTLGITVNYIFGSYDISWYIKQGYHDPENNIHVHLWPVFFFKMSYIYGKLGTFFDTHTESFKYPLISLNGRARQYRCHMIDLLARENMITGNAISWHGYGDYDHPWMYWKEEPLRLTDCAFSLQEQDFNFQEFCLVKEWSQSFLHLVSESQIRIRFCTEKTVMCLLGQKLFIIWGAPYMHKMLEELGFQLYDEIIDYSFDAIDEDNLRLEMIISETKRIINLGNYDNVYNTIKNKLEHNKQRAIELAIDPSRPNIIDQYGFTHYDRYNCRADGSLFYPFGL